MNFWPIWIILGLIPMVVLAIMLYRKRSESLIDVVMSLDSRTVPAYEFTVGLADVATRKNLEPKIFIVREPLKDNGITQIGRIEKGVMITSVTMRPISIIS